MEIEDVDDFIDREYAGVSDLPNVRYFVKNYAKSIGDNDQEAAKTFMFFEGLERLRGLQREIHIIKLGGACRAHLKRMLGLRRKGSLGNYEEWAKRMLLYLSSSNKR